MKSVGLNSCIFCEIGKENWIESTDLLYAIFDRHPVTKGHALIIPKVHRENFFDLNEREFSETRNLIFKIKDRLLKDDPSINGFNIGMNCGQSAGQTIFHCHIHFIPRRNGDVQHPEGGVRGVIPSMQSYRG